jgi:hypothetical protein
MVQNSENLSDRSLWLVVRRPIATSVTNLIAWFAALWGLQVSEDLLLLIAIALAMGVLNFVFAFTDAKKADDLDRRVKTLLSIVEITGESVTNLENLEPVALRKLTEIVSKKCRALDDKINNQPYDYILYNSAKSESELNIIYRLERKREDENYRSIVRQYKIDLLPSLIALWDELAKRTESEKQKPISLRAQILVGPHPLAEIARELERMARLLPN